MEETSFPSYSQVAADINDINTPHIQPATSIYPDLSQPLEKAMTIDDITKSGTSIPTRKVEILPEYKDLAFHWRFWPFATLEKNRFKMNKKVQEAEVQLLEKSTNSPEANLDKERQEISKIKYLISRLSEITIPVVSDLEKEVIKKLFFEDSESDAGPPWHNIPKPITSTPFQGLDQLWHEAITRFGFSKEKPENNAKLAKRIRDIIQSRLEYYTKRHKDPMIRAYQNELEVLNLIERNLLQSETKSFGEISPITKEKAESKRNVLPFEDEKEFYQCAEPWGIKRNGFLREKEATSIVSDRNTPERLNETSIHIPINYETLDKFHHDLVEIVKLKWYMEEGSLQPSEISMNPSQKKTIPKTLVTPLLEGHEIEWAEITEDTLKEFPHLSDRLKMQGLIQFMEEHPVGRKEALAQLYRKAKDQTYEALKNFFDWHKKFFLWPSLTPK